MSAEGVVRLHQFPLAWGRNVSPFTLKVEAWLKLTGIPFEVVEVRNPARGPKGKLPYIEDGGVRIGDSSLIIQHLERTRGISLDDGLDPLERAEALAVQRLLEEHLYFIFVYNRWLDPVGWRAVRTEFFGFLPPGLRQTLPELVRYRVRKGLIAQGLGRHAQDELYAMGRADLEALSVLLDDGPLFFRDRPTTLDCIAYGFLANLLSVPVETELKRIGEGFGNLRAFCQVMEQWLEGGHQRTPEMDDALAQPGFAG